MSAACSASGPGLKGIDAGPDFRTPVADRMYISTADGGGSITDAVIEAQSLIGAGLSWPARRRRRPPRTARASISIFPAACRALPARPDRPRGCIRSNWATSPATAGSASAPGGRLPAPGAGPRGARRDADVFRSRRLHDAELSAARMPDAAFGTDRGVPAGSRARARRVAVRLYASVYDEKDELKQIHGEAGNHLRQRSC